ncbi:hypothetical protein RhiirA4_485489 [Rhizophagus irregularis]|uniref:Uncharacterized protein n=1 Tax=Rhizophagus irregularis TaxID=588596 RepID=A0A2I1HQ72_9GLOM|nr:hypothetical protein RhiirA4_485489 [Rhizophagus irregularis]
MSSELKLLRQRISKLEAKNAKLEAEKAELLKQVKDAKPKDTQGKENITPNNNSSNFNLDVVYHEKSSEEKEMDNFLLEADKKSVDENIRQCNKEKKIQRESANQNITPEFVYVAEINNDDNLDKPRDWKLFGVFQKNQNFSAILKDLSEDNDFTIPFEQAIERDLMQQLSVPSTTVHSGYEEIIHWYGFAESYDKRINEICTINKVKINTAKQQVYQEVKKLLPDISDVNLRQQLSRTRKLYKLFNAVGVEKIKQVTYSTNAISNFNNTQI